MCFITQILLNVQVLMESEDGRSALFMLWLFYLILGMKHNIPDNVYAHSHELGLQARIHGLISNIKIFASLISSGKC